MYARYVFACWTLETVGTIAAVEKDAVWRVTGYLGIFTRKAGRAYRYFIITRCSA